MVVQLEIFTNQAALEGVQGDFVMRIGMIVDSQLFPDFDLQIQFLLDFPV